MLRQETSMRDLVIEAVHENIFGSQTNVSAAAYRA